MRNLKNPKNHKRLNQNNKKENKIANQLIINKKLRSWKNTLVNNN